jgi:hypothetical protein
MWKLGSVFLLIMILFFTLVSSQKPKGNFIGAHCNKNINLQVILTKPNVFQKIFKFPLPKPRKPVEECERCGCCYSAGFLYFHSFFLKMSLLSTQKPAKHILYWIIGTRILLTGYNCICILFQSIKSQMKSHWILKELFSKNHLEM